MGYKKLFLYQAGMPVWEESGLPIVKGPDYEARVETVKMTPQALNKMIAAGTKDFTVVDVRDPSEFAAGHIPGSINLPVATFAAKSAVLDKKKSIIVYCNGGGRSNKAFGKLIKLGYKKIFQTLFTDWQEAGYRAVKQ